MCFVVQQCLEDSELFHSNCPLHCLSVKRHDFAGQDFGQSSAELVLQLHVALTEITQNSACEWPLLGEGRSKMVSQTSNVLAGMAGRQHLAGVINQTPYMWPLNEMVSGESDFSYGGAGLHKQDFQETRQKL